MWKLYENRGAALYKKERAAAKKNGPPPVSRQSVKKPKIKRGATAPQKGFGDEVPEI